MFAAFLLAAKVGLGPAPCVAPSPPAPALAPSLLPRVIVRAQSGPAVAVLLSWRLGSDEPPRARHAPAAGEAGIAPLDLEEAAALETVWRCP